MAVHRLGAANRYFVGASVTEDLLDRGGQSCRSRGVDGPCARNIVNFILRLQVGWRIASRAALTACAPSGRGAVMWKASVVVAYPAIWA